MKRKILWMGLSFLVAAALVLSSCGDGATGEEEEEEEEAGEPQYGGTITWIWRGTGIDPNSWDITDGEWWNNGWAYLYQSRLLKGDIDTYGPRGTNEFSFNSGSSDVPEEYLTGDLAESWEVSAESLIFHLRHGVMWAGNDRIGMAPRELTADDVVFSLTRWWESPLGGFAYVKDITAEDDYTVVITLNYYDLNWPMWLAAGADCGIYPPEVVEAGIDPWYNQVSSGPFILTDHVKGSQATYESNPDYYLKTTINGKEYDIPFVDKLVLPVILDEATQIAVLRSGQADGIQQVSLKYKDTLATTSPELEIHQYMGSACYQLKWNCETGIFADMDIRRAMMIGTDLNSITKAVYGEGVIHYLFSPGSPAFTPIDEMPAETALLFEYDPVLAKQMIADAGHPDGFDTVIHVNSAQQDQLDIGAMLADQWSKIGVTLELDVMEETAHVQLRYGLSEGGYMVNDGRAASNELPERMTDNTFNSSHWSNTYFDEQIALALQTVDPAARSAIQKAMGLLFINEASCIPLPVAYNLCYWWPWVKNYYGETEAYYINYEPMYSRMWIDEDLKAEMGYE